MWIRSQKADLIFIIGPAFIASILVLLMQTLNLAPKSLGPIQWLILVAFIDVAHVWSTLFRTYLNRLAYQRIKNALWIIPLCCYVAGVILHSISELTFWRTIAYLAVFHFIRQQYGFFSIYKAKELKDNQHNNFDRFVIYSCSIIPLIIWHFSGPQEFNWFLKGDFFYMRNDYLILPLKILGPIIIFLFFSKEIILHKRKILSPKNLIVLGTYISWWTGIVWIKSDWSFTLTNIIAHGIPYFALIYWCHIKKPDALLWPSFIPIIVWPLLLITLGFTEELLWDTLLWRENQAIFGIFYSLPEASSLSLKALLVPLLALPQATHYILDGLIWRKNITLEV